MKTYDGGLYTHLMANEKRIQVADGGNLPKRNPSVTRS
jgi:hypothetical protein